MKMLTLQLIVKYEIKDKIDYWLTKMGYRFVLREVECPDVVEAGKTAQISLKLENVGVAPIYNQLPLKLRFKGAKTQDCTMGVDITKWLPGEYTETLDFDVVGDMPKGEYQLQISIGGGEQPSVAFANEMEMDDAWFVLGKISVN